MVVRLNSPLKVSSPNADHSYEIPAQYEFNTVNWRYLPDHVKKQISKSDKLNNDNNLLFFVFFKGLWMKLPSKECYVPKSVNGFANY